MINFTKTTIWSTVRRLKRYIFFIFVLLCAVCIFSPSKVMTANSLKQKQVMITKASNFTADSFNGVKAIYRKGRNDGSSKTYSCAAFVKKYYKKVYNKNVYNLLYNRTPLVTNGTFKKVSKPKIGDIAASNTNHSTTHWAIVKAVNTDNTVTLIEQNWKWTIGSRTYTIINRKIKNSSARFYRLKGVTTEENKIKDDETVEDNNDEVEIKEEKVETVANKNN